MPEIINRNIIQAKLSQFDERIDGAIKAAEIIMQVKSDAMDVGESISVKMQEIEQLHSDFQTVSEEWHSLKNDVLKTQDDTDNARNRLVKKIDEIKPLLETFIKDSENRLRRENELSRKEHFQLELKTKEHFQGTIARYQAVVEKGQTIEQLINSFRKDIEEQVKSSHQHSENEMQSRLSQVKEHYEKSIEKLYKIIDEKQSLFEDNVKKELSDHQQGVERQVVDFLNKQNTLVQNLTQQIDGFHRLAQTLSSKVEQVSHGLKSLEDKMNRNMENLQEQINIQRSEIDSSKEGVQNLGELVEQIVNGLKSTPLLGSKFKNLS